MLRLAIGTALLFAAVLKMQAADGLSAQLQGTIVDSRNGQTIRDAEIWLTANENRIRSNEDGHFRFSALPPGDYTVQASSANYLPFTDTIHLKAGETQTLAISLVPQQTARVDTVNVEGNALTIPGDPSSIDRVSLKGDDLKNLGTVLADDPFRAVHALPGVAANDDFSAQFSLRGADFSRIGIYLDGIKLHNAIHSLEGTDLAGSASSFNSGLVSQLDLYESAYPEKYADSSGGVLDVKLRDGNPDRYSLQLSVNFGTAGVIASGPFGRYTRCSWIAGFRKSYLQYLLARLVSDPSLAFGIQDEQGRATCHINSSNTVSLELIDSRTNLDRSSLRDTLGANSLLLVNQHAQVANLSWIYSPGDQLQIATHAAWTPDKFDAKNPVLAPLGFGTYQEKVWNTDATWLPTSHQSLSTGFNLRAIGENGFTENYDTIRAIRLFDIYRGSGILSGGYLAESWTGLHDHFHLNVSGRWDHHSVDAVTAFSPQAGVSLKLLSSLNLQMGWGQYVQFPELSVFGSNLGSHTLLPLRSTQTVASLEQRLTPDIQFRIGFYDRRDRDLLYQSSADPRLINGRVFVPPVSPAYSNSVSGRSRGVEMRLQRTSSYGISGWVSYSYGKTWLHDSISNDSFPSDWDQRHTLNVYGTYRLRPSVNLSAQWTYGSGFPVPGYLQVIEGKYQLSTERNRLRLAPYQRLDVRLNKTFRSSKWKKSLFLEVLNLTNRTNQRFGSLDGYSPYNGNAYVTVDTLFPLLPTIGFVLER